MPTSNKGTPTARKVLLVDDHAVFRDGLARIIAQEAGSHGVWSCVGWD